MKYNVREGDYRTMGAVVHRDGVVFTFEGRKEQKCSIVLYEKKTGKIEKIPVPDTYYVGALRSIMVMGIEPASFDYNFEIDGKVMTDPYARRIVGREKWGEKERFGMDYQVKSGFSTDVFDWEEDVAPEIAKKDMVMYKLHVRNFTMEGSNGGARKGTFEAVENRIGYLRDMGVTTVEFMPFYEFEELMIPATCELPDYVTWKEEQKTDTKKLPEVEKINCWGYTEGNYFAPKAAFTRSRQPEHALKSLIKALHKNDMECIMEIYFPDTINQNLMLEALRFWVMEYHVDGFRFDLMGLHDTETMNEIRAALDRLPGGKEILMYGEPWAAGKTAIQPGYEQALKCNAALLSDRIGFFNDDIRDSIKGSVFEVKETGFVNGAKGLETQIRSSVLGFCDGAGGYQPSSAQQSVSYVSAHDNYTLWDKLVHTLTDSMEPDFGAYNEAALAQNRLAAGIYFTCLGIPFLQAGEEAARTKYGDDNSYRSAAKVNQLDWTRMHEYRDLAEFYRGLILLRKSFPAWRQRSLEVLDQISFVDAPEGCVAFTIRTEAAAESVLTDNAAPWQELFIIYNANKEAVEFRLPGGKCSDPEQEPSENYFALEGKWQLLTDGTRFKIKGDTQLEQMKELEGSVWAEPVSITILGR